MMLSKEEVASILTNVKAAKVIDHVGVDVVGLVEIADFHLFNEKEEISFTEFLELVLQLRGGQSVTVRDIVNLRRCFMEEMTKVEDHIQKFFARRDTQQLTSITNSITTSLGMPSLLDEASSTRNTFARNEKQV